MTTAAPARPSEQAAPERARKSAYGAALWGLVARGVLYLLLALLALELVAGNRGRDVDTRGVFHELAHEAIGVVLLVIIAVGFAGFAFWHAYVALRGSDGRRETGRRLGDAARALVYAALCALAVSFLTTSSRSGNSDQTDKTWTARVLEWSGGRVLVGGIGVVVIAIGCYLGWRAVSGGPQDEPAVLDAAPNETPTLHVLGAIGNAARGAVVVFVGVFLLDAAIEYDADKTVGLDGALRRILDRSFGSVLVAVVALGFAAFGVYSIGRALANRRRVAGAH